MCLTRSNYCGVDVELIMLALYRDSDSGWSFWDSKVWWEMVWTWDSNKWIYGKLKWKLNFLDLHFLDFRSISEMLFLRQEEMLNTAPIVMYFHDIYLPLKTHLCGWNIPYYVFGTALLEVWGARQRFYENTGYLDWTQYLLSLKCFRGNFSICR